MYFVALTATILAQWFGGMLSKRLTARRTLYSQNAATLASVGACARRLSYRNRACSIGWSRPCGSVMPAFVTEEAYVSLSKRYILFHHKRKARRGYFGS